MSAPAADAIIRPGTVFHDDRGQVAQLHGIGIQRVGDLWYAWGEDKAAGSTFTAVACYTSPDLASWRFEGNALTVAHGDLAPDRVIERPKVLQRPDGVWVMLLHVDTADYSYARVGYAIAENPAGPYRYLHSERPMGNVSRDIGVYQEDGVGYLLSEDRDNGLQIYRLRPDYLGVESIVATLRQQDRPEFGYESPTMVRHGDTYYLFGSDLTGWSMNENKYTTATDLAGPWTSWRNVAPEGTRTFESQVSVVVPVGAGYVYIGDRWNPDELFQSPIVVLPLRIADGTAELVWHDQWQVADSLR
jgi:glycosyl hydrolase family 43